MNHPTPSPITSGEALKPCAFCGSAPSVRYIGNEHTKTRAVTVKCSNPECRVERTDKAFHRDHAWLANVAAEAWNRRPASAASAPVAQSERDAWISVDERLPAKGQDVIVLYWPYNNRENAQVAGTAHHVEGVFYDEDGNDMHPPSHWMPFVLPAIAAQQPADGAEAQG